MNHDLSLTGPQYNIAYVVEPRHGSHAEYNQTHGFLLPLRLVRGSEQCHP